DCAADPVVVGRQKADDWKQQQARVQQIAAIGLGERTELVVPGLPAYLSVDLVAHGAPAGGRPVKAELLAHLDPAVKGNPGHCFRIGEVLVRAAYFPDPVVCFPPAILQQTEDLPAEAPGTP